MVAEKIDSKSSKLDQKLDQALSTIPDFSNISFPRSAPREVHRTNLQLEDMRILCKSINGLKADKAIKPLQKIYKRINLLLPKNHEARAELASEFKTLQRYLRYSRELRFGELQTAQRKEYSDSFNSGRYELNVTLEKVFSKISELNDQVQRQAEDSERQKLAQAWPDKVRVQIGGYDWGRLSRTIGAYIIGAALHRAAIEDQSISESDIQSIQHQLAIIELAKHLNLDQARKLFGSQKDFVPPEPIIFNGVTIEEMVQQILQDLPATIVIPVSSSDLITALKNSDLQIKRPSELAQHCQMDLTKVHNSLSRIYKELEFDKLPKGARFQVLLQVLSAKNCPTFLFLDRRSVHSAGEDLFPDDDDNFVTKARQRKVWLRVRDENSMYLRIDEDEIVIPLSFQDARAAESMMRRYVKLRQYGADISDCPRNNDEEMRIWLDKRICEIYKDSSLNDQSLIGCATITFTQLQ